MPSAIRLIVTSVSSSRKRAKQVAILYSSMVLSLLLGIGTSVLNTRGLGDAAFGKLKFIQTVFLFVPSFLSFGFFPAGGRLVAFSRDEADRRNLTGAFLATAATLGVLQTGLILAYALLPPPIVPEGIRIPLLLMVPLYLGFPLQLALDGFLQGDNRITSLSALRMMPQAIFLAGLYIAFVNHASSLMLTLVLQFGALILVVIVIAASLRPQFSRMVHYLALLRQETKSYGFDVYVGALAGVASMQLGLLSVGYLVDTTNLGYLTLASTITLPLTLVPGVVGTTMFKEFSQSREISRRTTIFTVILSIASLCAFVLLIKPLFELLYPASFNSAIGLSYIIAIGATIHGLGDFYNRFLGAHGKGKALRNAAIIVGAVNVIGYSFLVEVFNVKGAAYTRIFAGTAYCVSMIYYYRRHTRDEMAAAVIAGSPTRSTISTNPR